MLRATVTSLSDPAMMKYLQKNKRMLEAKRRIEGEIAEIDEIIDNLDPVDNMREIEILNFRILERKKLIQTVNKVSNKMASGKPVFVPRRVPRA